jgi:hypothetical protein
MLRQSQNEEFMANSDLREWALKGAEQRLGELAEEARAIYAAFPELREQGRGFGSQREVATEQVKPSKRRRKGMSAAARKKVSLAQKKRWAEWRKKQGKSA